MAVLTADEVGEPLRGKPSLFTNGLMHGRQRRARPAGRRDIVVADDRELLGNRDAVLASGDQDPDCGQVGDGDDRRRQPVGQQLREGCTSTLLTDRRRDDLEVDGPGAVGGRRGREPVPDPGEPASRDPGPARRGRLRDARR